MPGKTETVGPEKSENEVQGEIPVNLWEHHVEFQCDGMAGGNYNPETVQMVFYADKPLMAGGQVRTVRVQVATMSLRRSRFRRMIQQMSQFADYADAADKEKAIKIAASTAQGQGTQNASS